VEAPSARRPIYRDPGIVWDQKITVACLGIGEIREKEYCSSLRNMLFYNPRFTSQFIIIGIYIGKVTFLFCLRKFINGLVQWYESFTE